MKPLDVVSFEHRLDSLFERIIDLGDDLELQANWAKYLCVLVSGYLEVSVKSVFREYAKNKSDPRVFNNVNRNLKFFPNPKMDAILKTTASFDPVWAQKLEKFSEGEVKDSVDSIVANRNLIAHGGNVGISYIRIKNYYNNSRKLIDFMSVNFSPK